MSLISSAAFHKNITYLPAWLRDERPSEKFIYLRGQITKRLWIAWPTRNHSKPVLISNSFLATKRSSKKILLSSPLTKKKKHKGRSSPIQLIPNTNSTLRDFRSMIPIWMSQKRREKLNGFPVFRSTFTIPEINKQLDGNIYCMRQIHQL